MKNHQRYLGFKFPNYSIGNVCQYFGVKRSGERSGRFVAILRGREKGGCERFDQWQSMLVGVADGLRHFIVSISFVDPVWMFPCVPCQDVFVLGTTQRTPGSVGKLNRPTEVRSWRLQTSLLPTHYTLAALWSPSLEWWRVAALSWDSSHTLYYGFIYLYTPTIYGRAGGKGHQMISLSDPQWLLPSSPLFK